MTDTERVKAILGVSKNARNSDRELFIIYMQKAKMNLSQEQIEIFRTLPDMQTIGRIRRTLQAKGEYPADPKVNEARYQKFKNVKENINSVDPEQLLESKGVKVLPWGT